MTTDPDRLWNLLPLFYRQQDEANGAPLRQLLQVLSEQAEVLEAGIQRLHDNAFIETCEDWAVPYIGELVGWQPTEAAPPGQLPPDVLAPRAEVANAIRWRRRKGTLALLPELARDVAGWPARAVEYATLVAATAAPNLATLRQPALVDLRQGGRLNRIGSAFESLPRTPELRRAGSHRRPGRYSPAALLVFAARTRAFPVTRGDATCIEERGRHCFTFSPLGQDAPLYTRAAETLNPGGINGEAALPVPIRRRMLQERQPGEPSEKPGLSASWYGAGRSLAVWAPDWDGGGVEPIPAQRFVVADLGSWRYRPRPGTVAIDPTTGRLAFPPNQPPKRVLVSYHHGFSAPMGGGEYPRVPVPEEGPADEVKLIRLRGDPLHGQDRLAEALAEWREARPTRAVIEFCGSQTYDEARIAIDIPPGHALTLRAAPGTRPVLRLLDRQAGREDSLRVSGGEGSRLALEGLLLSGRALRVSGKLAELAIDHCTFVPGWDLHADATPQHPGGPSLVLEAGGPRVTVRHSILGTIVVAPSEAGAEPLRISLEDSIVDASGGDAGAVTAPGDLVAQAVLTLRRCTVLGGLAVHAIALAENSILAGPVLVARRQEGCLRYCWVPPGSRTPPRHACQPDLGTQTLSGPVRREAERRLAPLFDSQRYGTPGYARLATACADATRRGAEDEAEMGAFHDLYWPQREAALRRRIQEFVPATTDAGLVFLE
jgi:hypothetical protein